MPVDAVTLPFGESKLSFFLQSVGSAIVDGNFEAHRGLLSSAGTGPGLSEPIAILLLLYIEMVLM